ncbi:hypothetical protein FGB62_43g124 [Gracilaria domingensis]|nr:hypothetical protein FGB62_43g124 [Gracilaria domingensis]
MHIHRGHGGTVPGAALDAPTWGMIRRCTSLTGNGEVRAADVSATHHADDAINVAHVRRRRNSAPRAAAGHLLCAMYRRHLR